MDRDRLKELRQTDLTESKINEDFLDWLKTKGPTWLLIVLLSVAGWLALVRWNQHKQDHFTEGWSTLFKAQLPIEFEEVAINFADIPGISRAANLKAADTYLQAVVSGLLIGSDLTSFVPETLDSQQREEYLNKANRIYQQIIDEDDETLATTLIIVAALNGKAAVAESKGEVEQAQKYYQQAAKRAEEHYPNLALRARARAETVPQYAVEITLPKTEDLPTPAPAEKLAPVAIDPALRDLLEPDDTSDADAAPPSSSK